MSANHRSTSPAGGFGYAYDTSRFMLPTRLTLPNLAAVTNHYDGLARLDYTALADHWGHVLDGCEQLATRVD